MAQKNILVVDDEKDILQLVEFNLKKNGYAVRCVESGEAALDAVHDFHPDLVLLDLMLPGLDGLEVCKQLKSNDETKSIPVIMVTAKDEEFDIVMGLELGADDYITKPFSPRVLLARVRTALRREVTKESGSKDVITVHSLTIDPGKHVVKMNNQALTLTFSEFEILHLLARRPGWVYSRYQIVDALRGEDYPVTERSVDVQIVGLRKKLGEKGKIIETVRGVGYKMKE